MNKKNLKGMKAQTSIEVTEKLIQTMADMSNDYNPIHMDEEYAANTVFGKRIAHGLLIEGLVSSLIGNKLPGAGAVFTSLGFDFCKPVFIHDTITAKGEITEVEAKGVMKIEIICNNQHEVAVAQCVAIIKYMGEIE